ncbi:hypothetical protein K505DRAFT_365959 [Melanomma pulvis-pyrius CBS 109.77]|uniref:F-box domain-containing protein n=1 Tax=Melanomma pulvis-pyrius CBS 109.77 TaxID=1314802 RepID=A0A6A6WZC7_9PLEO|nr:hypothetical protein K505DRAFT_365959 [Melanomma pulvis-pyrius CBS 109.77]
MEKQTSSPLIQNLSVELQQVILSNIPDVLSLRSAALSCRVLYNALLSAETIITTRVLLNQVDFDVLPEANIAQEALRLVPCTENRIRDFIAKHLHKRQPPPESWNLCDAVTIAKFHTCVSELALQFIATAAMKSPICGTRPITRAEISRIERAMYRFEIFCNLFRGFEKSDPRLLNQLWATFFLNFSPWENEQLACVHDHLVQAVYPADERNHTRPPFFNDPDTGPIDVWRWTHQNETWANFVNQDDRKTLREWGFVMWDRARLDESSIFQSRWEPPYPNDEESRANIQRRAEMQASWEARSKMYRIGGRGWWSFGDHSKIIWPNGKAPWEGRFVPALTVPNSIEEARDAFRLMKLPESVRRLNSRQRG